jgi:hypothetical protein
MLRRLFTIVSMLCCVSAVSVSQARLSTYHSTKSLYEDSDLVVVAEALETAASKDRGISDQWGSEEAVNTTFTAEIVLKGKLKGTKVVLLHYRWVRPTDVPDPPELIAFNSTNPQHAVGAVQYMLFLKLRADGRFEPTGGQTDPVESVRQLAVPEAADPELATAATTRPTQEPKK